MSSLECLISGMKCIPTRILEATTSAEAATELKKISWTRASLTARVSSDEFFPKMLARERTEGDQSIKSQTVRLCCKEGNHGRANKSNFYGSR